MAIEAVFHTLVGRFKAVTDAFQSLRLTVIEDRPTRGEVLLVERLGNLVEDLHGWLVEGLAAAMDARQAVAHPLDGYRARQSLGLANERFIRLEGQFFNEAVSHRMIDGLERFGRQRGGEWFGWARSVVLALQGCRDPLRALDEALLLAWQELCERLGSGALQVQTTSIGQQFAGSIAEGHRVNQAACDTIDE